MAGCTRVSRIRSCARSVPGPKTLRRDVRSAEASRSYRTGEGCAHRIDSRDWPSKPRDESYWLSTDVWQSPRSDSISSMHAHGLRQVLARSYACLLYTSDAADEEDSVD